MGGALIGFACLSGAVIDVACVSGAVSRITYWRRLRGRRADWCRLFERRVDWRRLLERRGDWRRLRERRGVTNYRLASLIPGSNRPKTDYAVLAALLSHEDVREVWLGVTEGFLSEQQAVNIGRVLGARHAHRRAFRRSAVRSC